MFLKSPKTINAIKLYSLGDYQKQINRADLIECILLLFKSVFLEMPDEYDIHGPYGIKKGNSIGLKAFKNKLQTKGHDKYYAITGFTEKSLGFELLLNCKLDNVEYSELIIWYYPSLFSPNFRKIVELINPSFKICSGYEIELDESLNIGTETKIKKGLFGESVTMSFLHLEWIKEFDIGSFRDVFKKNIFNDRQLSIVQESGPKLTLEKVGNINIAYESA